MAGKQETVRCGVVSFISRTGRECAIRKIREALEQKQKLNSGNGISFSNSSAIWTSILKTLFRFL